MMTTVEKVGLSAELTVSPFQSDDPLVFRAKAILTHTGKEPLSIDLGALISPSLTLEIMDAARNPIHLPPPPVPGQPASMETLKPGEHHVVEYQTFFPQWIEPGQYRGRFCYKGKVILPEGEEHIESVTSEWTEFTLVKSGT